MNFCQFDALGMLRLSDNTYDVPTMRAQYQIAKLNVPPRTSVR